MAEENRPRPIIEFESTGRTWDQIEDFEISDDFTVEADAWSATVYNEEDPRMLRRIFLPKSPVKLYLGEHLQLVGRIESTEDVEGSSKLKITGFDYLADLVGPNVDPTVRIQNTMTLRDALLEGFRPHGITEIETNLDSVVNRKMGAIQYTEEQRQVNLLSYKVTNFKTYARLMDALRPTVTFREPIQEVVSDATPKGTVGLLDWGNGLCSRFGAMIQPGTARNRIAVVVPDYTKEPVFEFTRNLEGTGNVQSARARRSWESVPTVTAFRGKFVDNQKRAQDGWRVMSIADDPTLAFGEIDEVKRILANANAEVGLRKRTQTGDPSKWYCPIYFKDTHAKKLSELEQSTRRTIADKLRKTLEYHTVHHDYFDEASSRILISNVLANVNDSISDVEETLWIMNRTVGYSGQSYARLTLIRPGSFQI